MSLLVTSALLVTAGSAGAHKPPGTATEMPQAEAAQQVLRVHTRDDHVIRTLAQQYGHLIVDRAKGVVTFDAPVGERLDLLAKGLYVSVDPILSEALNAQLAQGTGTAKAIPGYACYRTVAETQARLDSLALAYPQLAQTLDIGASWESGNGGGERLRVLRLTNRDLPGDKPVLFAMTAIHAREYTTAELNLRFAEYLLAGYGTDADATWILDHHEVHLLVQSNPDGRKRAETGLSWRKNTNQGYCGAASNSRGADLNRNFPFAWGTVPGGSSGDPCAETYRGPLAASEPETQAVVDYVRSVYPDLRGPGMNDPAPDTLRGIFLDIHSYSQLVLWPWGMNTDLAPNSQALEQLGRRFAWFNGYEPDQSVGLYPTDGTTDDFAYGELGVPAYTFELGTAFFQACASFESTVYPDNLQALLYAAKSARRPYVLPFGPETVAVTVEPDLPVAGESVRIRARVDDSRSSTRNGSVPVQPITAARAYLDTPPWLAGATPLAMSASDGSFDTTSEAVDLQLAAPTAGRQMVFVEGTDSSGATGPVSAAFLTVLQPNQVAELTGRISSRVDNSSVVGAQVQVGEYVAASDSNGQYARRVPAAATSLQVTAPGFEPLQVSGLNLTAGAQNTRDLQLYAYCPRLQMDAENGTQGWTTSPASGNWSIVQPNSVTSSRAWHDSPAGNYANNINVQLISPTVDLQGFESPVLRLRSYCDTEAGYDFGLIDVRTGPAQAWTNVYSCDGSTSWRDLVVPVPQLAGAAAAQIRFRLTSDTSQVRDGWYIDDIVLEAGGAACRALQAPGDVFSDGFETP